MFSNASVKALPAIKSTHSPLHLKLSIPVLNTQRSHDSFRFEVSWQLHEDCLQLLNLLGRILGKGWMLLNHLETY